MRFALIATSVAAAAVAPFAIAAAGPQMSGEQFLSAVRCTAYADVTHSDAQLAAAKWQLNAEARHQPAETAAQAQAEVSRIARQAVNIQSLEDAAIVHQQSAEACAGADQANAV